MNIAPVKQSQSFKAVDYSCVSVVDRDNFVRDNLKRLNLLGKNYDITLTSLYCNQPDVSIVDIDVRPLKKGLGFFKRLFRPTGKSTFFAGYNVLPDKLKIKEEFMGKIHEAIADLGHQIKLHK
jgi:hypothetical protein